MRTAQGKIWPQWFWLVFCKKFCPLPTFDFLLLLQTARTYGCDREPRCTLTKRRRRPWERQHAEFVQSVFLWVSLVLKTNCKQLVSSSADASWASTRGFLALVIPDVCHCSAPCPVNSAEPLSGFLIKQTQSPQSSNTFYYKHSHQFSCTNSLRAKSDSTWRQAVMQICDPGRGSVVFT